MRRLLQHNVALPTTSMPVTAVAVGTTSPR